MKFAALSRGGLKGLALLEENRLTGLFADDVGYPGQLGDLLGSGVNLRHVAGTLRAAPVIDAETVEFRPPVERPGKILCVGLNYADHTAEVGLEQPPVPEVFPRFTSSLVGHDQSIIRPPESHDLDYEAELVVVIGKAGRRISKADALSYVAGYSIFNDATLRDVQFRTAQWTIGKNFDATGGFGPYLVTPDALPSGCAGLRIEGRLNGEVLQAANISQLIYDVPALIALLSESMTLEPGDVILTGTPAGVGWSRTPKRMLQPGDVFEAEVEGVGILRNAVIDEVL